MGQAPSTPSSRTLEPFSLSVSPSTLAPRGTHNNRARAARVRNSSVRSNTGIHKTRNANSLKRSNNLRSRKHPHSLAPPVPPLPLSTPQNIKSNLRARPPTLRSDCDFELANVPVIGDSGLYHPVRMSPAIINAQQSASSLSSSSKRPVVDSDDELMPPAAAKAAIAREPSPPSFHTPPLRSILKNSTTSPFLPYASHSQQHASEFGVAKDKHSRLRHSGVQHTTAPSTPSVSFGPPSTYKTAASDIVFDDDEPLGNTRARLQQEQEQGQGQDYEQQQQKQLQYSQQLQQEASKTPIPSSYSSPMHPLNFSTASSASGLPFQTFQNYLPFSPDIRESRKTNPITDGSTKQTHGIMEAVEIHSRRYSAPQPQTPQQEQQHQKEEYQPNPTAAATRRSGMYASSPALVRAPSRSAFASVNLGSKNALHRSCHGEIEERSEESSSNATFNDITKNNKDNNATPQLKFAQSPPTFISPQLPPPQASSEESGYSVVNSSGEESYQTVETEDTSVDEYEPREKQHTINNGKVYEDAPMLSLPNSPDFSDLFAPILSAWMETVGGDDNNNNYNYNDSTNGYMHPQDQQYKKTPMTSDYADDKIELPHINKAHTQNSSKLGRRKHNVDNMHSSSSSFDEDSVSDGLAKISISDAPHRSSNCSNQISSLPNLPFQHNNNNYENDENDIDIDTDIDNGNSTKEDGDEVMTESDVSLPINPRHPPHVLPNARHQFQQPLVFQQKSMPQQPQPQYVTRRDPDQLDPALRRACLGIRSKPALKRVDLTNPYANNRYHPTSQHQSILREMDQDKVGLGLNVPFPPEISSVNKDLPKTPVISCPPPQPQQAKNRNQDRHHHNGHHFLFSPKKKNVKTKEQQQNYNSSHNHYHTAHNYGHNTNSNSSTYSSVLPPIGELKSSRGRYKEDADHASAAASTSKPSSFFGFLSKKPPSHFARVQ